MCDIVEVGEVGEVAEEIVVVLTPGAFLMNEEQSSDEGSDEGRQEKGLRPLAKVAGKETEGLFLDMLHRMPTTKYRDTNIGKCLIDSLTELLGKGKITEYLVDKTLSRFDRAVCNSLSYPDVSRITPKLGFKARKLLNYKFVEDVWTFTFSDVEFREYNSFANVSKLKIVAVKRTASDSEVMVCGKTLREYLKGKKEESDSEAECGDGLEFVEYTCI